MLFCDGFNLTTCLVLISMLIFKVEDVLYSALPIRVGHLVATELNLLAVLTTG